MTGFWNSKKRLYFEKQNCLILSTPMQEIWDQSCSDLKLLARNYVKLPFPKSNGFHIFLDSNPTLVGLTALYIGANGYILSCSQVAATAHLWHYDPSVPVLKRIIHSPVKAKFEWLLKTILILLTVRNNFDYMKFKSFYNNKTYLTKIRRETTNRGKIFITDVSKI